MPSHHGDFIIKLSKVVYIINCLQRCVYHKLSKATKCILAFNMKKAVATRHLNTCSTTPVCICLRKPIASEYLKLRNRGITSDNKR